MSAEKKDWTIGIVAEGPTDYALLNGLIRRITGSGDCLRIQPEEPPNGNGSGWKGVLKWCRNSIIKQAGTRILADGVPMDLLVVHLDGDVSRTAENRAVHCLSGCPSARRCPDYQRKDPLRCNSAPDECPVEIPCPGHSQSPDGYAAHLSGLIRHLANAPPETSGKICPVVICDSTEAWIVAAFDQTPNPEEIPDPWRSVVAASGTYHGLKLPKKTGKDAPKNPPERKKTERVYQDKFLPEVKKEWDCVKRLCPSADRFERDVLSALGLLNPA